MILSNIDSFFLEVVALQIVFIYEISLSRTLYFRFWSSEESLLASTCNLNTLLDISEDVDFA